MLIVLGALGSVRDSLASRLTTSGGRLQRLRGVLRQVGRDARMRRDLLHVSVEVGRQPHQRAGGLQGKEAHPHVIADVSRPVPAKV